MMIGIFMLTGTLNLDSSFSWVFPNKLMKNQANDPAAISNSTNTKNNNIFETPLNWDNIKNLDMNKGNKGMPIMATLPIIRPHEARG